MKPQQTNLARNTTNEVLTMSDHISEQEILKLLKKLDPYSHSQEREGTSSTMRINLDDEIVDGFIKVEHGKIIVGNTGNIVFAGDVIIYGDVMDKMIIESPGNIYVSGSVFNSTFNSHRQYCGEGKRLRE
jgi:hypothetical protein